MDDMFVTVILACIAKDVLYFSLKMLGMAVDWVIEKLGG